MRDIRVEPPIVDQRLLRAFGAYVNWYVRRHFHAARVCMGSSAPSGKTLLVVLNHPSWWDPLVALLLARRLFPEQRHYAPIDAAALRKYRFFARLGFFGIEQGTAAGAAQFLRMGRAILSKPDSVLWVTAQGTFADPRVRPILLRGGTGHLLASVPGVVVLPVALEYPFWEEKYPEALVRIGDAITGTEGMTAAAWTAAISDALTRTQDLLAVDSLNRNASAFEVLTAGRVGVSAAYDLWRALRAVVRGERFHRSHGSERLS
jgi:1-acyl-sn-glycerol-3-phosphate acyltransferase